MGNLITLMIEEYKRLKKSNEELKRINSIGVKNWSFKYNFDNK